MSEFRAQKVISSLPALQANTLYFVRTGDGFDLFCSDQTGSVAHKLNDGDARIQREPFLLRGANTGSVAITLPIFYISQSATIIFSITKENFLQTNFWILFQNLTSNGFQLICLIFSHQIHPIVKNLFNFVL